MALPEFTMRQLLEAGVHFGHQTHRWNPKMAPYLFGDRNGVHIIDLAQTVPLLHQALVTVRDVVAGGGRILFVGTKRQASEAIAESARRSAQYYINHRWLGGTLTNWKTVSNSIRRLRQIDEILEGDTHGLTKKELLRLTRERDKHNRAIGGIKDMGGLPDLLFIIDTNKEQIALQEAAKLKIPVVAVLDSNCDPKQVAYPIPGNDDAGRAINLYCDLVARAVLDGISQSQSEAGIDIGEASEPVMEETLKEPLQDVTPESAAAPQPAPEVTIEALPQAAPEAKAEPEAAPEAKAEPEAAPEAKAEPEAAPEAKAVPEVAPDAEAAPQTAGATPAS